MTFSPATNPAAFGIVFGGHSHRPHFNSHRHHHRSHHVTHHTTHHSKHADSTSANATNVLLNNQAASQQYVPPHRGHHSGHGGHGRHGSESNSKEGKSKENSGNSNSANSSDPPEPWPLPPSSLFPEQPSRRELEIPRAPEIERVDHGDPPESDEDVELVKGKSKHRYCVVM